MMHSLTVRQNPADVCKILDQSGLIPVKTCVSPARLSRVLLGLTSMPCREMSVPGGCNGILRLKMFRRLPMMMGCPLKMLHGIAMMLDGRMLA
jgi:hypothetical protein